MVLLVDVQQQGLLAPVGRGCVGCPGYHLAGLDSPVGGCPAHCSGIDGGHFHAQRRVLDAHRGWFPALVGDGLGDAVLQSGYVCGFYGRVQGNDVYPMLGREIGQAGGGDFGLQSAGLKDAVDRTYFVCGNAGTGVNLHGQFPHLWLPVENDTIILDGSLRVRLG